MTIQINETLRVLKYITVICNLTTSFQRFGHCTFTADNPGSISSWETKISQAVQCDLKILKS